MATIHPSRLGLVPQSSKDPASHRRPSSPRRSPPPPLRRSPSPSRERNRGRRESWDDRRRDEESGVRHDRDRGKGEQRSRSRERRDNDGQRDHEQRARRPSPSYGDYSRAIPPPPPQESSQAPWHSERNMYPNRRDRDEGRPSGGGGPRNQPPVSDFFEARRLQRDNSTLSIWPPSPKAPTRSLSPERGSSKRRRKHRRDRSPTPSDSDSDSEEERRRRRKRREKEKEKKRSKDTDRSHKKKRTRSPSAPTRDEGDGWVEKSPVASFVPEIRSAAPPATSSSLIPVDDDGDDDDDDDDEQVGPKPAPKANTTNKKEDERQYGGALLRGEGSAMAAFLKDGTDSRIPRRGEIGLTSDEINKYEQAGYVMSGSRHRVMNAVRMRKENQVISAEEKRGILKLQQEERERRELVLREEFQELLNEKLKGTEGARRAP